MDDDEILALVQGDEAEEEDTEPKKPKITVTQAVTSIEKLTAFIAQEEGNLNLSMNFSRELNNIKKNLQKTINDSKVQTNIDSYFTIN